MEYITTKEASTKWGISTIRVTVLAREGRIPGAQRLGKSWLIPATATKPKEIKANRYVSTREKPDTFSFPLYHFRPDYSYMKAEQLSKQQQSLLLAETAVLECRFADAYPLLESILHAPEDIYTEIGCLWNAVICCIALNKPESFSKFFLRLQMLMSEDFPHRDDMAIILDTLKTYVESIGTSANKVSDNADIHDQCLPLFNLNYAYARLAKEAVKRGSADAPLLEITLCYLEKSSSVIAIEMMHCYLTGIYYLRNNMTDAKRHAEAAVRLAFENNYYFPLVSFYSYFDAILSPVLTQYPEDFQKHCYELTSQYEKNFTNFYVAINEDSVLSKLDNTDYSCIYGVLTGLSNPHIAEKLNVHPRTVKVRIDKLCQKLGVKGKKQLREYLLKWM